MTLDTTDIIMLASIVIIGVISISFNFHLQKKGYSKTKAMTIPYTIGASMLGIVIDILLKPPVLDSLIVVAFI